MTPTTKLRWVERDLGVGGARIELDADKFVIPRKVRILQQWWAHEVDLGFSTFEVESEWRDVPVEEEEK